MLQYIALLLTQLNTTSNSIMPQEQLASLLAKLQDDADLREKLQGASDLDATVKIAKDAGFEVSKADLLRYQAKQVLELSDEELESVPAGGKKSAMTGFCCGGDNTAVWPTSPCFETPVQ